MGKVVGKVGCLRVCVRAHADTHTRRGHPRVTQSVFVEGPNHSPSPNHGSRTSKKGGGGGVTWRWQTGAPDVQVLHSTGLHDGQRQSAHHRGIPQQHCTCYSIWDGKQCARTVSPAFCKGHEGCVSACSAAGSCITVLPLNQIPPAPLSLLCMKTTAVPRAMVKTARICPPPPRASLE